MRNLHAIRATPTSIEDWIRTYFNSASNTSHIGLAPYQREFLTTWDLARARDKMMRDPYYSDPLRQR